MRKHKGVLVLYSWYVKQVIMFSVQSKEIIFLQKFNLQKKLKLCSRRVEPHTEAGTVIKHHMSLQTLTVK